MGEVASIIVCNNYPEFKDLKCVTAMHKKQGKNFEVQKEVNAKLHGLQGFSSQIFSLGFAPVQPLLQNNYE